MGKMRTNSSRAAQKNLREKGIEAERVPVKMLEWHPANSHNYTEELVVGRCEDDSALWTREEFASLGKGWVHAAFDALLSADEVGSDEVVRY